MRRLFNLVYGNLVSACYYSCVKFSTIMHVGLYCRLTATITLSVTIITIMAVELTRQRVKELIAIKKN